MDSLTGSIVTSAKTQKSKKPGSTKRSSNIGSSTTLVPKDIDVLSGRGGRSNKHPGNRIYRRLIQHNKAGYQEFADSKIKQSLLVKSILQSLRQNNVRFLKQMPDDTWQELTEQEASNKTSQALREKDKVVKSGETEPYSSTSSEEGDPEEEYKKDQDISGEGDERNQDEDEDEDITCASFRYPYEKSNGFPSCEHVTFQGMLLANNDDSLSDLRTQEISASRGAVSFQQSAPPSNEDCPLPRLMWSLSVSRQDDSIDQKWSNLTGCSTKRKKDAGASGQAFRSMPQRTVFPVPQLPIPDSPIKYEGYQLGIIGRPPMSIFDRFDSLSMACSAPKKPRVFDANTEFGTEQVPESNQGEYSNFDPAQYRRGQQDLPRQYETEPVVPPCPEISERSITKDALDQLELGHPLHQRYGRSPNATLLSPPQPEFARRKLTLSFFDEKETAAVNWANSSFNKLGINANSNNYHERFQHQAGFRTKQSAALPLPPPPFSSAFPCSSQENMNYTRPTALHTASTSMGFPESLDDFLSPEESAFENSFENSFKGFSCTSSEGNNVLQPSELLRTTSSALFSRYLYDL